MFTRFRRHWVETCHCAEFRFLLDWRASNWSTWTEPFLLRFVSSTVATHWPLWSPTTSFGSLSRKMATVGAGTTGSNTGSAWATEQHSVATDKSLSEFPLQRYKLLTTNTLRVDPLSFETESPERVTERHTARTWSLWSERLAHGDAGTHCRADKLWGLEEHCCKHWLVTCHTGTRKHEWRTVWTEVHYTHSRVTVQLFQPCSTARSSMWQLASTEDVRDTVSWLQKAAL